MDIKRIGQALADNWTYIIWTFFCFAITWLIFGASQEAIITTLIIYAISIAIAFTPLAEAILRLMHGVRPIERGEDIQITKDAFNEVYESALADHSIVKGVNLYLEHSLDINAYALGCKTVAITRGALLGLTEDEHKGLYAHEIGHIVNGNTQALLTVLVGNLFLSAIIWIALKLLNIFHAMIRSRLAEDVSVIRWLFTIVAWAINIIPQLGSLLLLANGRANEYKADDYAVKLGYGEGLLSALYYMSRLEIVQDKGLFANLKNSHPYTSKRIARLEDML